MRWFKHDSDAHQDAKLKRVRHRYGIVGYGLYWYCIELIAGKVDKHNISFELEEDAELIAIEWNLDQLKVEEMMRYFVEIALFESENSVISCMKLAKRIDDTNAKNPQIREILAGLNQSKSDSIRITPNNSEQIRESMENSRQTRLDKNINNKSEKRFSEGDYNLADYLFSKILHVAPKTKKPNLDSWADTIRLMRERDELTHQEIKSVFDFANCDSFWSTNILSPGKLRDQFAKLDALMGKNKPSLKVVDYD